ncbi:MAG: glycine cleavage system protein R [Solirubrobacterales bacterium]
MNLAVTAIGRDRPGIVAGLTGVLVEAGGNVDDSQMSLLHGQFAVMLIVSVPDDTHVDRLRVQLDEAGRGLGLDAVTVCPVSELDRGPDPTHVVTIYGADRPGIVHRAAQLMAEREVNITDLKTRRTASGDGHLYTRMMEVALPGDAGELEGALASMAEEAEVEASISELEVEVI